MSHDMIFAAGALLCLLSVPAMVSAWVDRRRPSVSVLALLGGAGMVAWTYRSDNDRYALTETPDVFIRVIGEILRAI